MANYVTVDIVCPCGHHLEARRVNADSNSTTRGTKHCPACKQTVEYAIRGANVYTNYKK